MDFASIIGLLVAFAMMVMGIVTGDDGVAGIRFFWDLKSVLITFGGAIFSTLASYSMKDFVAGMKSFLLIFKVPTFDIPGMIGKIIELSNVARKEGLLALEEVASELDDDFLKKGILLIVDGTDPELVRAIMETELISTETRHKTKITFWQDMGSMGPAWGMIGDQSFSYNPPFLTVALITTFYGSVLANWICAPTANKLSANSKVEIMMKEIMIEGLLSIQAGENPRVIEEKLKSFLSPVDRVAAAPQEGGE